jgi:hypothetical protein
MDRLSSTLCTSRLIKRGVCWRQLFALSRSLPHPLLVFNIVGFDLDLLVICLAAFRLETRNFDSVVQSFVEKTDRQTGRLEREASFHFSILDTCTQNNYWIFFHGRFPGSLFLHFSVLILFPTQLPHKTYVRMYLGNQKDWGAGRNGTWEKGGSEPCFGPALDYSFQQIQFLRDGAVIDR